MRDSEDPRVAPAASANAGRASRSRSGATGPAWLRFAFGETVNKWQIICPLVALAIAAVVFATISGRNHHRYFVYAHSRMVGEELAATTNSPHLVQIGPGLHQRLSEFFVSPAGLSNVLIGDEPSPIGDGSACSRVVLTNAAGGRLGIRLRQDAEPERFHVLGFWTITEPSGPANRSLPNVH